ncbi:MAG: aldehyde ferredoxin oxidoreductase family protein [Thermoplasmata archaeon]
MQTRPLRLLRVDLTAAKFSEHDVPEEDALRFVGGRGLAAKLLYDENPRGVDALGPRNLLMFMTGPYTGTEGSFAAFHNVTTKSPLTGTILSAHSGGHWGPMLRRTGLDGIVIAGRSSRPAYLLVTDEGPELVDAGDLWGMDSFATTSNLQKRHRGAKATAIGPAGEKMVRFASIMNDLHRAAGRGGAGAVMGSKNLKAVVVRGRKKVPVADPGKLRSAFRAARKRVLKESSAFSRYGTSMVMAVTGTAGAIPTRNFQSAHFPQYEKIGGDALLRRHVTKSTACFRCPLRCGKESRAAKDYTARTRGPEYETLATFGANLGNSNLESIIMANSLCNRYAMDTISCADTIACAMELFEKGILTKEDTGGMTLAWGNHRTIVKLVRMIGEREGIGGAMGEGSKRFAKGHGLEAARYSMNVKGMEFPGYDPRGIQGMALAFATSARGACHLRGPMYVPELFQGRQNRFTVKGKAKLLKELEDISAVYDCMIMCKFGARLAFADSWRGVAALLNAATGLDYTEPELRKVGARVLAVERLFNIREGFGKKDDRLPERLYTSPVPEGPSKGAVVNKRDFIRELEKYYALRGWGKDGVPTKRTMDSLGLSA